MKNKIFLLLNLWVPLFLCAQEEQVKLLGESADGKIVKMLWIFKSWDKNTVGFDLKRREINPGTNTWQKLNSSLLVPGIALNKNLSNTGAGESELLALKQKLQTMIANKKAKEITASGYLNRLNTDQNALQGLSFAMALDYDFALLNGFAFIDGTAATGKQYEYGLFLQDANEKANNPATVFKWTAGTKTLLNPVTAFSGRPFGKSGKIQLNWNVNNIQLKEMFPAGFIIYKKKGQSWIKLFSNPINPIAKGSKTENEGSYSWVDTIANKNEISNYGIVLQSIFKNQSDEMITYLYDPAEHPTEYKAPFLEEVMFNAGPANAFKISWSFTKEMEPFAKGFLIEKANLPGPYKSVSEVLPLQTRNYSENTYSPPASYITYRVVVIYKDETKQVSNEKLYYYLPVIKAPTPVNLKVIFVKNQQKLYADLSWDAKKPGDTLTDYYILYASNPLSSQFMQVGGMPIKSNTFRYEINYAKSSQYKFCVSAMSRYKSEGDLSDTVTTYSPSQRLPYIQINTITLDSNRVLFDWEYPEIQDLKGFRAFQNGNMVASEFQLSKKSRSFKTPGLQFGATYNFSVQAVSEQGVLSEVSLVKSIDIKR